VNRILLRLFLFAIGFVVLFVIVNGPGSGASLNFGTLIGRRARVRPWRATAKPSRLLLSLLAIKL
jgi:hypothetical protein